ATAHQRRRRLRLLHGHVVRGLMRLISTAKEWAASSDGAKLVRSLRGCAHRLAPDRQMRLIPAAFGRRVWSELTDQGSRDAVLVGERFADGLATVDEISKAHEAGCQAQDRLEASGADPRAFWAAVIAR